MMKLFFSTTLSTVLTGGLLGCAASGPPDSQSQGTIFEALGTSLRGEVRLDDEKHGRLVADAEGGFHAYTFSGKAGTTLNFVLSSHAFRAHLLVVGPSGHRWNVPGTLFVYNESQAWREITLPQDGAYRVLVTSHDNLANGRAVSSGDYQLEVFGAPASARPDSTVGGRRVAPRPRS